MGGISHTTRTGDLTLNQNVDAKGSAGRAVALYCGYWGQPTGRVFRSLLRRRDFKR
jgi:hypothetical protein